MSSTNSPIRSGLDAYYTPESVARACVATLGPLGGVTAWEPHAGRGAFVRSLARAGANVHASDIDPTHRNEWAGATSSATGDFLHQRGARAEWIVGNPPFNEAEAHVRHALSMATVGVGFLLRLAFLASAKRAELWRVHALSELHVLVSRPSFTGGGTDSADYGFFIWRRGKQDGTRLFHLDWKE